MKNRNLVLRTLTCLVGIPLLACMVFLFPQYDFIGLRILITASSILGSIEMSRMLYGRISWISIISLSLPISCLFLSEKTDLLLSVLLIAAMGAEIKGGEKDDFEHSVSRMGKRMLCLLYPSYFLTFPIRFTYISSVNSFVIGYYILIVFANDIFAYIFGMVFGKTNNAHLKASPKKSYAGFAGGFLFSILFSLLYTYLFAEKAVFFENIGFRILCPVVLSVFGDIGDLIESCIKRSAKVKDSSNIIPGHGGVLDRLDSILMTAPLFYFIVRFLAQ